MGGFAFIWLLGVVDRELRGRPERFAYRLFAYRLVVLGVVVLVVFDFVLSVPVFGTLWAALP